MLLAETENALTALHLAAQENHIEILQKLWVWAEEWQLNTNELKKKLLLAKDKEGYRVASCSMFWEISGIADIMGFGYGSGT